MVGMVELPKRGDRSENFWISASDTPVYTTELQNIGDLQNDFRTTLRLRRAVSMFRFHLFKSWYYGGP